MTMLVSTKRINLFDYVKNQPSLAVDPDGQNPVAVAAVVLAELALLATELTVIAEEYGPEAEIAVQEELDKIEILIQQAEAQYPKVAQFAPQWHHILPRAWGGAYGYCVRLPAAYHQFITNAFNNELSKVGVPPTDWIEIEKILLRIYTKYPIRGFPTIPLHPSGNKASGRCSIQVRHSVSYWKIVFDIWRRLVNKTLALIALSESKKTKVFKEDFENQTYPQKVFSAIWMLDGQVLNGGFEQYFHNYSGCTIAFVVEALEAIGAIELANICIRAIKVGFPKGLPLQLDPDSISATFSPSPEKLDSLAKEYYKASDDVTALLYDFVLRYPEEFGSEPFSEVTLFSGTL